MSKRPNEGFEAPNPKRIKELPIIFNSDFFEVKERQENTIKAVCKQCGKIRTAYISSTGNLTRHYKEKHPELHSKLVQFLSKKYIDEDNTKLKQTSLPVANSISKECIRKLIMNFVVNENLSYNIVRKSSFRELLDGISGKQLDIPCYETFVSSLKNQCDILKRNLILLLSKQEFVCETIDAWSSRAQSYIGITVHFLDENTLERHSYVLAFRRIKFKQTYDNLAKFIHEVNKEFGLDACKIRYAVTDGDSNFGKAFREYGIGDICTHGSVNSEETTSEDECDLLSDEDDIENERDMEEPLTIDDVTTESLDFDSITGQSNISIISDEQDIDEEIILPKQFRCTSHNLNLVGNVDFFKHLQKSAAKTLRSVFSKLFVLWRLVKRSSRAKTFCQDICGCVLLIPNATRWNSRYDASKKVLYLKDKIISLITTLHRELNVPNLKQLTNVEWNILSDYVHLMAPLATGLDRLQGENNASLGYVMPTLYSIKRKVIVTPTISQIGERFRDSLKIAIDDRFGSQLKFNENNRELIVAAVSHPLFKLDWIENEEDVDVAREIFKSTVINSVMENDNIRDNASPNEVIQDDFYDYLNRNMNSSRRNSTDVSNMEIFNFLNDSRRELNFLHQMPEIKRVFLKFNTTLSSSAPVERLFSQALLIFTPRRNRLSASNFERSLIVKHNKSLLNFTN